MNFPFDRVIWDFNGTILDDLMTGIDSANELLTNHGLPPIESVEHYYRVFGFPIRDYYERLGFDFAVQDFETLAHEWVGIYLRRVRTAPAREGIRETVAALSALGVPQTVLSMTENAMLRRQLSFLGLENAFDELCGLGDVYASSKLSLASDWRGRHPTERALYIGDTTHDAESAAVIGCDCLLLAGGHESREVLLASGVRVIDRPQEILAFFAPTA